MPDVVSLQISGDERRELLKHLESALKEMRVEVRRTSTPKYHDELAQRRQLLESLLAKVREAPPASEHVP